MICTEPVRLNNQNVSTLIIVMNRPIIMKTVKIFLMITAAVFLLSCGGGSDLDQRQRDRDSNRDMNMQRDTINEGSLIMVFKDQDAEKA